MSVLKDVKTLQSQFELSLTLIINYQVMHYYAVMVCCITPSLVAVKTLIFIFYNTFIMREKSFKQLL